MKKRFTKIMLLLFVLVVGISNTWATDYVKVTSSSDLVEGAVYVIAEISDNSTKYLVTGYGSKLVNTTSGFSVSSNTITTSTATPLEFTLGTVTSGNNTYYTLQFKDGNTTYYLGYSGSSTNFEEATSTSNTKEQWSITPSSNAYRILNVSSSTRYIGRNGSNIGPYSTSNSYPNCYLFKKNTSGGSTPSINANNVEITYEGTSGSIAYEIQNGVTGGAVTSATITASSPSNWLTVTGSNPYSSPIGVTCSANSNYYARTATVRLTYTYNTNQTVTKDVTVTQTSNPTGPGSSSDPYTVAEARAAIDAVSTIETAYTTGIVYQVDSYNSTYHSITYWIKDASDATTPPTNPLQVYGGLNIAGGSDFSSKDDIKVGDAVVVCGTLKKFNSTYEFDSNNRLISLLRAGNTSLSFTYVHGGSADAKTLNISSAGLTENISGTLTGSDFEISDDNGTTWNKTAFTITKNTSGSIKVRLKSGLDISNDYSGSISLSSSILTVNVALTGSVTTPTHALELYSNSITGGSISFSPDSPIAEGATVTLTAEPESAYNFGSWIFYKESGDDIVVDESISVNGNNEFTMPQYDLWVDATFSLKPTNAITCAVTPAAGGTLESAPTSAYNGQTVTLTYTEASGYILSSVVITKTEDGSATGITPTAGTGKTFTFTMPPYAVTATATFITGVTDVMTPSTVGVNSSSYTDWNSNGISWTSDAVYKGNTSGHASNPPTAIQMRSSDNCGIVSTTTGGKVKKIRVTWSGNEATNTNNRKLDVYGKNTAYTAASDLYNDSYKGTLLGSITYSTDVYSGELTISGDYAYVGLRAQNGAIYFAEIKVIWDPIKYTVTYDANGGSGTMTDPNSPYTSNSTVTVLSHSFTAPVISEVTQEFARWNTKADGSGTNYNPGATFKMPKENVTLYAQWIAPCTVKATMSDVELEATYQPGEDRIELYMLSNVSVLGGCDITEYGFVYSTSVVEPTIAAANCTKIEVGTEYAEAGDDIEATIESATLGATYYVRSYATNNAGTAYSDAKSVTIASSYPTYTITYKTNGNSDGSSTINQGNALGTLPTPTESYIPDGYEFVGWYNGESYGSTAYPTLVTPATVPTGNMNLKAIFKISPSGGEQCIEITVADLTGNNAYGTTHSFTKGTTTFNAYGVYKNNGIQMNTGNGTYIKNTNTLPGVITRFSLTWNGTPSNNTVTMYANAGSAASTSSTKLAKLSSGSSQAINDLVGSNYNYFYLDGTTVTGACVMTSFKIYYIDYYYTTSATVPSGEYWHVNGSGVLTDNTTIPAGSYTLSSTITVPTGKTLTINGYLGTTPENLIVEDGGQIITSYAVNATFEKEIESAAKDEDGNWYTISTPIGGINITDVTNLVDNEGHTLKYNLYRYNEAIQSGQWEAYNPSNHADFTTLEQGRGYLYRNNGKNLAFAGEVNVGAVTVHLTSTEASGDLRGFNLVGNPFGHNIYKGKNGAIDNANLSDGFYFLNDNGGWQPGT